VSPEERLQVDRLVLEAAALEPKQREAFLRSLPTEEERVAAEVGRRLRASEVVPDGFLQAPATEILEGACGGSGAAPGPPDPPPGDERYEIRECLGIGGMARVYTAFDRRLVRPVALKVLDASDPETPRRLLREARAQARVRHDHVLEIYDTGDLGGQPYIAMEHAGGGTLSDWTGGGYELSLEQTVRLVKQAAEGLHAAHREGLLHGDVKPSNVLIEETSDGELQAKIGDFGIATELAEGGDGNVILGGTPEYMAPELRSEGRGATDRRSDIYSLGVTLHQALTGERPPRGGSGWSDLRARFPDLPADLTAIIARCLAREPADRYGSARRVAEDLGRFLDGDVVEAYADRFAYRVGRFAARHRTLLILAGISVLLLAAALTVAAVLGVRAVRANTVAEQRRTQAEDLIGFMLNDLRDKLEPVGRLDLLDDVGERAMKYFAAVPEAELSDEELARRATALHQIGDVRVQQGDLAGAQGPFEESLVLARKLAARDPDSAERLFGLGQSEFWVGYAAWKRGLLGAARMHFEAYRSISEELVAEDPVNLAWQRELSYAHSNLGSVLQAQGDLPGALERFEATLAIDRRLAAAAESDQQRSQSLFELAASHNTVGVVLEHMGRLDEALAEYEADLALRRALSAKDPNNQRWREFLGTSQQFVGHLLSVRGDLDAAQPHLEAARELFDTLAARDPGNGQWLYKQALSYLLLGRLDFGQGDLEGAGRAWRTAHELARTLAQKDPERIDWRLLVADTLYQLSRLARAKGDPGSARRQVERALAIARDLLGQHPDDRQIRERVAEDLLLLGDLERTAGDRSGAGRSWHGAVDALEPVAAGSLYYRLLVPWEQALRRVGRTDEADRVRRTLRGLGVRGPVSFPDELAARG